MTRSAAPTVMNNPRAVGHSGACVTCRVAELTMSTPQVTMVSATTRIFAWSSQLSPWSWVTSYLGTGGRTRDRP